MDDQSKQEESRQSDKVLGRPWRRPSLPRYDAAARQRLPSRPSAGDLQSDRDDSFCSQTLPPGVGIVLPRRSSSVQDRVGNAGSETMRSTCPGDLFATRVRARTEETLATPGGGGRGRGRGGGGGGGGRGRGGGGGGGGGGSPQSQSDVDILPVVYDSDTEGSSNTPSGEISSQFEDMPFDLPQTTVRGCRLPGNGSSAWGGGVQGTRIAQCTRAPEIACREAWGTKAEAGVEFTEGSGTREASSGSDERVRSVPTSYCREYDADSDSSTSASHAKKHTERKQMTRSSTQQDDYGRAKVLFGERGRDPGDEDAQESGTSSEDGCGSCSSMTSSSSTHGVSGRSERLDRGEGVVHANRPSFLHVRPTARTVPASEDDQGSVPQGSYGQRESLTCLSNPAEEHGFKSVPGRGRGRGLRRKKESAERETDAVQRKPVPLELASGTLEERIKSLPGRGRGRAKPRGELTLEVNVGLKRSLLAGTPPSVMPFGRGRYRGTSRLASGRSQADTDTRQSSAPSLSAEDSARRDAPRTDESSSRAEGDVETAEENRMQRADHNVHDIDPHDNGVPSSRGRVCGESVEAGVGGGYVLGRVCDGTALFRMRAVRDWLENMPRPSVGRGRGRGLRKVNTDHRHVHSERSREMLQRRQKEQPHEEKVSGERTGRGRGRGRGRLPGQARGSTPSVTLQKKCD